MSLKESIHDAIEAMARAHDQETAAQMGEQSPWEMYARYFGARTKKSIHVSGPTIGRNR
jgi:hypothetical protein